MEFGMKNPGRIPQNPWGIAKKFLGINLAVTFAMILWLQVIRPGIEP